MRHEDQIRLQHMLDAALDTCQFTEGHSLGDLESDRMRQFAILHCIEVIGEAAGEVSQELRSRSPHIPWKNIIAMRNRLAHGYFDVDLEIVWKTVTTKLPILIGQVRILLEN
ncbi:MAG: DUF86 domain-containing protein [Magnetococcus sp. DMHC-1]|nr:DUF86 domain-containing protein [Magnetococcales bacterium]